MIEVQIRPDSQEFPEVALEIVREIAVSVELEVRALLPCLPAEITLLVGHGARFIPETDELGGSVAPGLVSWTVNTARTDDAAMIARASLRHTLFHELHHQARGWVMRGGMRKQVFIEGPVSEGLATAFERDEAEWEPPWGVYPEQELVERWVRELLGLPVDADHRQWMFSHPDGRRWIGYKAGTFIADRATAAGGTSAAQLAKTPTTEILVMAGFG